jgi:uncharacterized Fe-S radical SAM superfamily protein PflX
MVSRSKSGSAVTASSTVSASKPAKKKEDLSKQVKLNSDTIDEIIEHLEKTVANLSRDMKMIETNFNNIFKSLNHCEIRLGINRKTLKNTFEENEVE